MRLGLTGGKFQQGVTYFLPGIILGSTVLPKTVPPTKFLTYKDYNEADESGIVECKDNLQSQKGIYVASGG